MRLLATTAVVAFTAVFSGAAFAQEDPQPVQDDYQDYLGLGTKQFKVRGGMHVETWFDDNILLTDQNETDDAIVVLVPSLQLRFDHGQDYVTLDYKGRDRHFNDNSDLNGMEHYVDALVHFRISKFYVELGDKYANRRDPFSVLQIVDRLDSLQNDAWVTIGGDFDKFDVEISGSFRRFEIFDSFFDLYDHRRAGVSVTGLMDIMPKTQALLEYGYSASEFDDSDILDSWTSHRVLAGLKGELTPKIRVNAKAGFVQVINDDTNNFDDNDDELTLFALIGADWDVLANGTLRVEFQHQPVESIFTSVAKSLLFKVGYDHKLSDRASVNAGAFYETQNEFQGGEDRWSYGFSGGAKYLVGRHLHLEAWGELRAKRSDNDLFEYDNVHGFFGAGLDF